MLAAFPARPLGGLLDPSPAALALGAGDLTNLATDNWAVMRFYDKRGTADQSIKKFKRR